ncbi:MAG: hypothetical protein ABTQ34_07070 [Bdellovibrionales bacterium]
MTNSQAVIVGAAMICATILADHTLSPAIAQSAQPFFQLEHHSNSTANAGVFRLNTENGEVSYCYISGNSDLVCTRGVR